MQLISAGNGSVPPALATARGVLADIERVLASGSPDAAKVSAVRQFLYERGVPPSPPRTSGEAAARIASRLAAGDLATDVFAALLGAEISIRVIGPHERPATAPECALLRLPSGGDLYVREGLLMAGTVICARTRLLLVPDRIRRAAGDRAWGRIWSGEPAGAVLAGQLRRACRTVEVPGDGGPVAVRSSAVLAIGAVRVGQAREEVPDPLCARLAVRG